MSNVHFLNLPFSILAPDITVDYFSKMWIATVDWNKCFSQELLNFFNQHNLKIIHAESFFNKSPLKKTGIHIDSFGGNYTKVNFIYGTGNSKMCWYNTKEKNKTLATTTDIGSSSIQFSDDEVILVESKALTQPALVQVGIPHNVINISEDRLCLSIVFVNKFTGKRPTMEESCKIFKSSLVVLSGLEPLTLSV